MRIIFCGHCHSTGVLPVYVSANQWGKPCPYCADRRRDAQQIAASRQAEAQRNAAQTAGAQPACPICGEPGEYQLHNLCWDCSYSTE